MQIVSSYGVEIKKKNIPLRSTLDIFRKAVSYLIPVYAEAWEELSEIRNPQKRFNEAEHLVCMKQKRIMPDFCLTVTFLRCPPI